MGLGSTIAFKRKTYDGLLEWKRAYADRYSILLEGPRHVGKSTIVEAFVRNEYDSFILVDFSQASREVLACFDDISNLNLFFLRLQAATGVQLHCLLSLIPRLRRNRTPPGFPAVWRVWCCAA